MKYRRNVGSLSIDMSANYRTNTLGTDMSVHISTDISTDISWSIYRPSVGRYVDRHIGRVLVDMSTDISIECRSIYPPIHRSRGAQNTHDPKLLKRMFVDFKFSTMKTQVSAYLNPMQNSVFQFSVADFHSL